MSRLYPRWPRQDEGFPRVSGDEPSPRSGIIFAWEFSPRERG